MTGMGEDVYTDRSTALDALTEEGQRMGMYGDAPYSPVEAMVEAAAKPIYDELYTPNLVEGSVWPHEWEYCKQHARAVLESLGIPLSVLAELKAGTRKAVRVETFKLPSGRNGCIPNTGDVFDASPKTTEKPR